ncbi:pantetheine-phosphate adenylyltransferase [Ignavibacteria bacterium CHB1]|nr:MAG: pantetheine-phosphate adenylyltransferase [Chlorobiota bacterium]MBV6398196.1 Phosphopantetheine adenylyltransferase [Ignavibacteria bacterium]MCC6885891.1 pantetheine-phosphate adenylyltransferase [Ignavibacteriales bacterium]MCE7953452.1 pantetheine-phosphate adenylyltransferase [Chlorobi bacterium CHB7]MDL1887388.1 pantetheine-phosphate adenylyltransferase [Ignavibacteria bacterium CHB1]RIK48683.1 MAG: pantetheine-phosphate adenylyltransferase [Ignavibacteriota bacterium]
MKKVTAVYPGTFDPVTNGHLDVIERAMSLFDEVIVCIAVNSLKSPLFSKEERKNMLIESVSGFSNVTVDIFEGLLVKYAEEKHASVIIRGLRAISDFEYEFQLSLTNRKLSPAINTIFLMPNEKYTYLDSSLVRELASYNADIQDFVPKNVQLALKEKFGF